MRKTIIAALVLASGAAQADIIISNLSATRTTGTLLGPNATTIFKAGGFTMGADAYELDSVTIRITGGAGAAADLEIWRGAGSPQVMVAQLTGPVFGADGNYTFTPTTSVTLEAGTTYWVYANNSPPSGEFIWDAAVVTPSGSGATSAGYIFNGGSSSFFNAYQVEGTIAGDCACLANLTAPDCATNTNDFFQFLAFYQAGDSRADFAPGGGINTNDFFAYLAAYQADLNNPDCPG